MLYTNGDASLERVIEMKYKLLGLMIIIGILVLLVSLPGFANPSNADGRLRQIITKVQQDITNAKNRIENYFKGVKPESKQAVNNVKQDVANGFKSTRDKVGEDTKIVRQKVAKGFKGVGTQVKKDAQKAKQKVISGFKSLKSD